MPTTKGIMGFLRLGTLGGTGDLRVSSMGLKASQEISAMDTIDNNYDYTAYRYGPIRVEGDVGFPVPVRGDFFESIIKLAAERDATSGRLNAPPFDVEAKYDHTIGATYRECKVNTLSVTIDAEEALDFSYSLIGTDRQWSASPALTRISPERMLTWDLCAISSGGTSSSVGNAIATITPAQVKNFSFEINNNLSAFFGLDGNIFVQSNNIVAGKREVSGSIEVSWNGSSLENHAYLVNQNTSKITSKQEIIMNVSRMSTSTTSTVSDLVRFNGVIFNMEDISMTNDFFMGTQTWRAYGDEDRSYKAISFNKAGSGYVHW